MNNGKRNERLGSLSHWLRNVKTKNAAHAPHLLRGPAVTRRTMTGTRGLRYLGAAALLKQRVALVRTAEGEGIHLHADQPTNLNDRLVHIAVAKRQIWRRVVINLASMKSPKRTLRPQTHAKPEIDIELQDDRRGGNRKTPMSDPAGKLPEATQRAE